MLALSVSVLHYPYSSKRKKPLLPMRHETVRHAYMEVTVSSNDKKVVKVVVVHGLTSAPILRKAKHVMLYVSSLICDRGELPDTVAYQDIVDWIGIPVLY